jgi:16S rRNA (guanine527-N7)-methyltransferase
MDKLKASIEEGLTLFDIGYDSEGLAGMCRYVESLEKWNRRINLVGLKQTEAMVRLLIYDAFFLLTVITDRQRVLDLGSGAGVLGIPMAILSPEKNIVSVDKALRKIQFQKHVKRLLDLSNYVALHGRIEDIEPLSVDALVAKAFGSVKEVIAKGKRHVAEGGKLFLVRGRNEKPTEEEGFALLEARRYRLPKGENEYQLFVYKKVP